MVRTQLANWKVVLGVLLGVAAASFALLSQRVDGRPSGLRALILERLGVLTVRNVPAVAVVTVDDEDGGSFELPVLQMGSITWTLDGELLLAEASDPCAATAQRPEYEGLPTVLREVWGEYYGYVAVGDACRAVYFDVLMGLDPATEEDVWVEICRVEYNRLVRGVRRPWCTWESIERQATALRTLAEECGAKEVVARLGVILETCDHIRSARRLDLKGELDLVGAVCLAELDAGDGRWGRVMFPRVGGLYSGGDAFWRIPRGDLARIVRLWDSQLVTRYVVRAPSGYWRLITLGERIRYVASDMMGRGCTSSEFLTWIERR